MAASTLRQMAGVGGRIMPPFPFGRGHTDLGSLCQIHAEHDVLDCQCRRKFSDSNAWIALTYIPPKELHWPVCTGWKLAWYRKLPIPVSVQSCERCPIVVNWCLMLCLTQCNRSPAWSVQWPGTASTLCLCPLPTSSKRSLG